MAIEFLERCETLEECYEFMLAYAGQGLPGDDGPQGTSQIREFLQRAAGALAGLVESFAKAATQEKLNGDGREFTSVLARDAQDSLAIIRLVLAQPSISSQLIDNLNASSHLRALLTDLFLVGDIVRSPRKAETTKATE